MAAPYLQILETNQDFFYETYLGSSQKLKDSFTVDFREVVFDYYQTLVNEIFKIVSVSDAKTLLLFAQKIINSREGGEALMTPVTAKVSVTLTNQNKVNLPLLVLPKAQVNSASRLGQPLNQELRNSSTLLPYKEPYKSVPKVTQAQYPPVINSPLIKSNSQYIQDQQTDLISEVSRMSQSVAQNFANLNSIQPQYTQQYADDDRQKLQRFRASIDSEKNVYRQHTSQLPLVYNANLAKLKQKLAGPRYEPQPFFGYPAEKFRLNQENGDPDDVPYGRPWKPASPKWNGMEDGVNMYDALFKN